MATGGFSSKRLARVRELLERHVNSGFVPGVVAVLARHGEVHVEATGTLAFEGAGSKTPMAVDTICRMGSMTKPIVAACAMTLVEDCTLSPDEWMRQLGALPLVHQPGERWMYDIAAAVTGVLIARATGKSFGDALRARICEPLGMQDTGFSVGAESIDRLSTAYQRDNAVTGQRVVEDRPDGRWSRPPAFEGGGGGLVSTANDYLAFATALLAGGAHRGERVLARPSVT